MKTPKNNSHPEKETGFSAGHGNADQLSFFGKILGSGKRAAMRGFTFIEIAFVITAFLVLSAIIYTTVGGSAQLDPLKAKSLLQNTRTVAAAVRRAEKYLESTPLNLKALEDEDVFTNASNNSKNKEDLTGTAIGSWTGPFIEGIEIVPSGTSIVSGVSGTIPTGGSVDSTLYIQKLNDITGNKDHHGFLYVSKKAVYYVIGKFSKDDDLLENYINLCNNTSETTFTPFAGAGKPPTKCILLGQASPSEALTGEGDLVSLSDKYNRIESSKITVGNDDSNYYIGYRITDVVTN